MTEALRFNREDVLSIATCRKLGQSLHHSDGHISQAEGYAGFSLDEINEKIKKGLLEKVWITSTSETVNPFETDYPENKEFPLFLHRDKVILNQENTQDTTSDPREMKAYVPESKQVQLPFDINDVLSASNYKYHDYAILDEGYAADSIDDLVGRIDNGLVCKLTAIDTKFACPKPFNCCYYTKDGKPYAKFDYAYFLPVDKVKSTKEREIRTYNDLLELGLSMDSVIQLKCINDCDGDVYGRMDYVKENSGIYGEAYITIGNLRYTAKELLNYEFRKLDQDGKPTGEFHRFIVPDRGDDTLTKVKSCKNG